MKPRKGTCGRCGQLADLDVLGRALRHPSPNIPREPCMGEGHPSIEEQRAHYLRRVAA